MEVETAEGVGVDKPYMMENFNNLELYREVVRQTYEGAIFVFDKDLRCILVEGRNSKAFGTNPQSLEGKSLAEAETAGFDWKKEEPDLRKALGGIEVAVDRTYQGRFYKVQFAPIKIAGNDPLVAMTWQDITMQVQTEKALEEAEYHRQILFDNTGQAFILLNKEVVILAFNRVASETFSQLLGKELYLGKSLLECIPTEYQAGFWQNFEKVWQGETVQFERFQADQKRWISYFYQPAFDERGAIRAVSLAMSDVTEKRRITDELGRASRLQAIGVLAGGIAHDFNNILTSILGNISLAQLEIDKANKELIECLAEAEEASLRAAELTGQLLIFAKGGAPVKKTIQLNETIEGSVRAMLNDAKVQAEFNVPNDLWTVEVDSTQMSQVIQNVVLNALQAMPIAGSLKIAAHNLTLSDKEARNMALPAGRYISFSIQDTGEGITAETLPHIFDPYFTTKKQGSGLGLSICYSIIKRHEGHIGVESEVGQGTTVQIYLPVSEIALAPPQPIEKGQSVGLKKLRVLVMDDEVAIQLLLKRALEKLDYGVTITGDGAEAIERYKAAQQAGEPFELVIMDLTVPGGMGGREAIQKLLALDSKAKVIVSSGYFNDPVMANYRDYGFSGLVSKPYRLEELLSVIKEII